jgi:hypothetical protein
MDITTIKSKAKEKKDQVVGFMRNHWEDILIVGVSTVLLVGLEVLLNKDEYNNSYDDNYLYDEDNEPNPTSCTETEISQSSQVNLQKDSPKKFIGEIDITGSRLKINEKQFLEVFSEQYDRFKGKEQTIESKTNGWSSDGKYTRWTKTRHSFGDDIMSITVDENFKDDDGLTGSYSTPVELKARNIINYVKEYKELKIFDDVRDIVDLL